MGAGRPTVAHGRHSGRLRAGWPGKKHVMTAKPPERTHGEVAQTPVGKPIAVLIWRNRTEMPVTVITEKMPQ